MRETTRVRSGRGIGDSLYLRPIAEHLAADGHRVVALSDYPAIFEGSGVLVQPFTRVGDNRVAHYTSTMADQTTTQFQAMLRMAKIDADVKLRFAWTIKNRTLAYRMLNEAAGRPLILVHGGREPMQRGDGFALELIPKQAPFVQALEGMSDCFLVRIGKARNLYKLPVHVDLTGKTSIADLLDLASVAFGVVAQCSFAVPLAEVFNKPLLAVWAREGLRSKTDYIRTITPAKVLCNARSRYMVDDWDAGQILEQVRAFRNA